MKNKYLIIHGKAYFTITHNKIDLTVDIPCVFIIDRMRYTLCVFSCYYNNPKLPIVQPDGSVVNVAVELPAKLQYAKYISVAYAEKLRTENMNCVYANNFTDILHLYAGPPTHPRRASCTIVPDAEYMDFPMVSSDVHDTSKLHKQQSMGKVDRFGFRKKRRK